MHFKFVCFQIGIHLLTIPFSHNQLQLESYLIYVVNIDTRRNTAINSIVNCWKQILEQKEILPVKKSSTPCSIRIFEFKIASRFYRGNKIRILITFFCSLQQLFFQFLSIPFFYCDIRLFPLQYCLQSLESRLKDH